VIYLKKLLFTIPFLLLFYGFIYQLNFIFKDIYFVFDFGMVTFIKLVTIILLAVLANLFFSIFVTLAVDPKLIIPIIILAAIAPFIFLPSPYGLILALGSLATFGFGFISINNKLATYFDFNPSKLLNPSIKTLTFFLILFCTIIFYFYSLSIIKEKPFQIPDSLIDSLITLTQQNQNESSQAEPSPTNQFPKLTKELVEQIKENPQVLKQYGLTPQSFDELIKTQNSPTGEIDTSLIAKSAIKDKLQMMLNPYLKYLPILLAAMLFSTLYFIESVLIILTPLVIKLIFMILEKSNFIKFTTETREVKKLVV
jgi:hypothetical protein